MRSEEAKRRLQRAGWQFVRRAGDSHEMWRRPDGALRTLGLQQHRLDRNEVAAVKQAERRHDTLRLPRNPTQEALPMTLQPPGNAAAPSPSSTPDPTTSTATAAAATVAEEARFTVYRSAASRLATIYCSAAAVARLGAGARVAVSLRAGVWRIEPDAGGLSTVREYRPGHYVVSTTAIAQALPVTGRVELPSQPEGTGFILFPERVDPVPFASPEQQRPAVTAPRVPARPAATSLDDLKTALEMLRLIASDLGAELYLTDGVLHARIVL